MRMLPQESNHAIRNLHHRDDVAGCDPAVSFCLVKELHHESRSLPQMRIDQRPLHSSCFRLVLRGTTVRLRVPRSEEPGRRNKRAPVQHTEAQQQNMGDTPCLS